MRAGQRGAQGARTVIFRSRPGRPIFHPNAQLDETSAPLAADANDTADRETLAHHASVYDSGSRRDGLDVPARRNIKGKHFFCAANLAEVDCRLIDLPLDALIPRE